MNNEIYPPIDLFELKNSDLYKKVFNELKNNANVYFPGENKPDDNYLKYLLANLNSTPPLTMENTLIKPAIKYRNVDILLYIFRMVKDPSNLISNLVKSKDINITEEFLNNLTIKDKERLVNTVRLEILIRLPRKGNNCNEDLIDLYFNTYNLRRSTANIITAINEAKKSHCPKLLDAFIENLDSMKYEYPGFYPILAGLPKRSNVKLI